MSLGPQGKARTSKKPPKWVGMEVILGPFDVLGNVVFSHCFLEILFELKGWHRERPGCVQAPERGRKRTAEVAVEASRDMSGNRCFTAVKPYFRQSGGLPGGSGREFFPAMSLRKRSGAHSYCLLYTSDAADEL